MTAPATGREAELLELIVGGETSPCWLDHHGYCQAHRLEDPCSVAMAVAALYGIDPPAPPPPPEPTREHLVELCTDGVVPVDNWSNRDTAGAQRQLGECRALLAAGCEFSVYLGRGGTPDAKHRLVSDDSTWWVQIDWPGFNMFEYGSEEGRMASDHFYVPTRARLDRVAGKDWYC